MAPIERTTDEAACVRLPETFANCTVLIEQVSETELRILKGEPLPEEQVRFLEETPVRLSVRDAERLAELLENPPPPNEALRRLMARYQHRPTAPDGQNGFDTREEQ
jgi:hypothetical protein